MMRAESQAPAMPPEVADAFGAFPAPVRDRLLEVRRLIFATAADTEGVGPLTETLKWGEPAYLTEATKSGTTVRLGWPKLSPESCAVLVHCRTSLVESFRARFADSFAFEGNRAILLPLTGPLPEGPLRACLAAALTYHLGR